MKYRDFFSKKGTVNKDIKTLIPEGVSLKEFYKGVAIEKESVEDEFAAAKLAKGNLEKDAKYYTKLHGDNDEEMADAECGVGADTSGDDYDENDGLPLVGGALAVPHVGQPIKLGKIVQVGAEFGKGPATGELSGMTAIGNSKDAGGLPVKSDGDKETITAGGKSVDTSIATKSVGGNVVPGEGQKQGGPNSHGTIAGTSKLAESKDKVRRIVKKVLKEITFDEKLGKWTKINENEEDLKNNAVVKCPTCGNRHAPLSSCSTNEDVVNMKMGNSHKKVQPRQYKISDDDFARTNQYEPEITEMYDEEEESIMNERYLSLVNASRNLSESELSEMKTLREKLERLGEKSDHWIQKAVNPAHKGYCTPMSKPTCTPHRKALAKRFKSGNLEEEGERSDYEIASTETNPNDYKICKGCKKQNYLCDCPSKHGEEGNIGHDGFTKNGVDENTVDMKMGPAYKVVAPRQARVQSDDQARNIQFEPTLTEMDDEDNIEFKNGDKVILAPNYADKNPNEVFTLSQWDGKKGRISDGEGRGWNIRKGQILHAPKSTEFPDEDDYFPIDEIQNSQIHGAWRQNGGNGFSFIVHGKEFGRISKAIGNKFIVSINGKNMGTVTDAEEGKHSVESAYYQNGQNSIQTEPTLAEHDDAGVTCPECGNAEGNNVLNPQENPHTDGGSAICGKCGHTWNTTDEEGNKIDTDKLDPVEEIGGQAVQHRSYRTANDDHQLPKARWSDEVYEGMSQVAKTIKKGMKPKRTKKPSAKKK